MTFSMNKVIDILKENEGDLTASQLGFILTVLRDNSKNDEVHEILSSVLKEKF